MVSTINIDSPKNCLNHTNLYRLSLFTSPITTSISVARSGAKVAHVEYSPRPWRRHVQIPDNLSVKDFQ